MPGTHDGFGGADRFSGAHPWAPLLFMGASLLWFFGPVIITSAYLWWRRRRPALASQPPARSLLEDDPSSFELLRRRYVVGEIDTPTFEVMTERLLISERAEELTPPPLARSVHYARYLRREPWEIREEPEEPPETDPRVVLL